MCTDVHTYSVDAPSLHTNTTTSVWDLTDVVDIARLEPFFCDRTAYNTWMTHNANTYWCYARAKQSCSASKTLTTENTTVSLCVTWLQFRTGQTKPGFLVVGGNGGYLTVNTMVLYLGHSQRTKYTGSKH